MKIPEERLEAALAASMMDECNVAFCTECGCEDEVADPGLSNQMCPECGKFALTSVEVLV